MNAKEKSNFFSKNKQKILALIMAVLTVVMLLALSSYAWFSYTKKIETLTKVKNPNALDIRAANADPIINFDLNGINIEEIAQKGAAEYRIFSVNVGYNRSHYKIQLAHTTNIPLKYTLYHATWEESAGSQNETNSYIEYHPLDNDTVISYYELGNPVGMTAQNEDEAGTALFGRTVAENYDDTYNAADKPEKYAIPIYLISDTLSPTAGDNTPDYYVLKIEWDTDAANNGFIDWNRAENNKETDVIYITASRTGNIQPG